jgi:hypothetical protein
MPQQGWGQLSASACRVPPRTRAVRQRGSDRLCAGKNQSPAPQQGGCVPLPAACPPPGAASLASLHQAPLRRSVFRSNARPFPEQQRISGTAPMSQQFTEGMLHQLRRSFI